MFLHAYVYVLCGYTTYEKKKLALNLSMKLDKYELEDTLKFNKLAKKKKTSIEEGGYKEKKNSLEIPNDIFLKMKLEFELVSNNFDGY